MHRDLTVETSIYRVSLQKIQIREHNMTTTETSLNTRQSELLFNRAQKVIPGGVNSPVRAFRAVGGSPRFIASAKEAYITDVDGNTYIDYVGSWGPMILGHANPQVIAAITAAAQKGL